MNKYYDMIALDYDQLVADDVNNDKFPYGGYLEMQHIIANYIYDNDRIEVANILDIGIGTASLYEKISPKKYKLTGIDNSKRMLEVTKLKFSDSLLIHYDILKGIPEEIAEKKYDFIIINYLFKHFEINVIADLINQFANHLAPFGKIFIGDIMFSNETQRNLYLNNNPDISKYSYFFHTFTEIKNKTSDNLALSFMEINLYTGLLIVENYYESSLHFEKSLLKYKTNTVKWKSSQSKSKRE